MRIRATAGNCPTTHHRGKMKSFTMGRGLTLQPRLLLPIPTPKPQLLQLSPLFHQRRCAINLPPCISTGYKCCYSLTKEEPAMTAMAKYKEAFSRRIQMAGLKLHHRIGVGVGKSGGFIDGLLAIVVDHGLRAESNEKAHVSHRVSGMGIRCEIAYCNWLDGRPKQGHVQEAAREMSYQMFQKV